VEPADPSVFGEYPLQSLNFNLECEDVLQLLLEARAEVNCVGSKVRSAPLLCACKFASAENALMLIKYKADVNVRTLVDLGVGMDCLQIAGNKIGSLLVPTLIRNGYDVNAFNPNMDAPIHTAVRNADVSLINALLEANADVNSVGNLGQTPIMVAASVADGNVWKAIMEAKPDVNICDTNGEAVIHMACSNYLCNTDPSMLKSLIECGVGVNVRNLFGLTPLDICLYVQGYRKAVSFLLEANADLSTHPAAYDPYLHTLVFHGWTEEVESVINSGVDLNQKSSVQRTPLHLAVLQYYHQILDKLIQSGAVVNVQSLEGDTPLHMAIQSNNMYAVTKLLEAGTDVNLKNNNNQSPANLLRNQVTSSIWEKYVKSFEH